MDRSWMYNIPRNSEEYLTKLEEFISCANEDMIRRGIRMVLCPCRKCGNLRRLPSLEDVRDHLICQGFQERYTRWIWHDEKLDEPTEMSGTKRSRVMEDEDENNSIDLDNADEITGNIGRNMEDEENEQIVENELEEMMQDVAGEFIDIPNVFNSLNNNSKLPLFPGCTKFSKITAVFKLYNLKAKNS